MTVESRPTRWQFDMFIDHCLVCAVLYYVAVPLGGRIAQCNGSVCLSVLCCHQRRHHLHFILSAIIKQAFIEVVAKMAE